jgi:hypothetical protein
MKKMNYGGMGMTKMKTGGMTNPNAAVKAATSTKNQIGGGNPKSASAFQKVSKGKSSGGVNKPQAKPSRGKK